MPCSPFHAGTDPTGTTVTCRARILARFVQGRPYIVADVPRTGRLAARNSQAVAQRPPVTEPETETSGGLMKARIAIVAAALSLTAAAWAAPASAAPSAAAGTCNGATCDGLEPNGTTCANDAINASTKTASGRTIILRYSPSCRAAWGKITGAKIGDQIWTSTTHSGFESATVKTGSDTHTRMVDKDRPAVAKVCAFTSTGADIGCTARY
ncbi:DUF2690 domain-containing protein [Streptomyces sp. NPDC097727]|uniref:DUF2690 domain-containing protein n=1 Tax=Streptomyces sp. NPDC097727 TaxID=3366092 RepID=UPI0037F7AA70